jgi:aminoglycoside phosphotransferase (APT) family kinase protein
MTAGKGHVLRAAAAAFEIPGRFASGAPYGTGHINDTYAVTFTDTGPPVRYILQRINHAVFKDPPRVMANIARVTRHLRAKLTAEGATDLDRRTLTLIPTKEGGVFHVDSQGNSWRMYIFIEGAQTYDEIENMNQAYEAARAFGRFQAQLVDLPGGPLEETIPGFHDTPARFDALQAAISADALNRAAEAGDGIAFANARAAIVGTLLDLRRAGRIPTVTTHNDTKLNNVMLDDATGEGLCVIDLDTVMPGLALYDFGDMARTAMRPCPEDERDLSKVVARVDLFAAITRGYLASAGAALNRDALDHLAFSARLITFEIGLRFLTDYLQGDVYFKTHRPGHNLDRARVQFAMVQSMEAQMNAMQKAVAAAAAAT